MKIVDQTIPDAPTLATAPDGAVDVRADQVVIHAGLTSPGVPLLSGASKFPVIVDSGSTGALAIRRGQLRRWTGLALERPNDRRVEVNGVRVAVEDADLWLHGLRGPLRLDVRSGIDVYEDDKNPARLPILGTRAILQGRLKVLLDGENRRALIWTGWNRWT